MAERVQSSVGDATIRPKSTIARSSVVLPDPLGPINTATVGSRTSGLAALRLKQAKSGAVPGILRSRVHCFAYRSVVGH